MENLVCHPDVAKQLERLPAAIRMEFKRLIYFLGRSQFDRLDHWRSIDHIVTGAFEIRIPLPEVQSFVFFYVREKQTDIVFLAFTEKMKDLRLPPDLVDQAQNNHIYVLDSLDERKGPR